ncbi:alpha/beta hydrolase [Elioraea sp.]|uniref:alpha/beta hydrolase n=1 Tax=Elioraea sp. TaxID=2185103 RepID=UPI0025BF0E68|nr:alpha/beta hydrolase [Elioraea sp.]
MDALNAITPSEGASRFADIPYGEGERRRLDLYVPAMVPPRAPVLVFFYGGSWTDGDRADYRFAGTAFAGRGYITAIPDYRVHPEVTYPAFLEDGAAAVAALPGILAARGLPSDGPVIIAGHSAGAHIAMMLALDPRWLAARGLSNCRDVAAVLGLAGPYDFLPMTNAGVIAAFGAAVNTAETQPITHAGRGDPPAVLLTGTADVTVLPRNSQVLARALRAAGTPASVVTYDGVGHVALVAALAAPLRGTAPVLDDADSGLRQALAEPARAC